MKRMKDEKTSLVTESGSHEDDCDESVPKGWKRSCAETPVGPIHQSGEGAPLQQINTRARDHTSQNQDDEPIPKGWKKEEESMDGNLDNFNQQTSNGAELDVVTLGSSNESSRLPGNRKTERQDENPEMKVQKSKDENLVGIEAVQVETAGGPCHQLGGGAPLNQINTRACDHTSQNQDDEPIPKGWKKEEEKVDQTTQSLLDGKHTSQNQDDEPIPKGWKKEEEKVDQTTQSLLDGKQANYETDEEEFEERNVRESILLEKPDNVTSLQDGKHVMKSLENVENKPAFRKIFLLLARTFTLQGIKMIKPL